MAKKTKKKAATKRSPTNDQMSEFSIGIEVAWCERTDEDFGPMFMRSEILSLTSKRETWELCQDMNGAHLILEHTRDGKSVAVYVVNQTKIVEAIIAARPVPKTGGSKKQSTSSK